MSKIKLTPLEPSDRENFIKENQYAFKFGALEEFGERDGHIDENGEIISRETINKCIDEGVAYRIICDDEVVGGLVLKINTNTNINELELLFVSPKSHGKGIGYAAWKEVERLYPKTEIWETCTPYFEKRNIHFYINKCGFSAVEFFNEKHIEKNQPRENTEGPDEMFRFIKVMDPKKKMKRPNTIDIILPAFCAVISTVCSWIYIPSAIPFTLQTFAVFLVTALFGAKCSLISIIIYISIGIIGIPVFSGFNSGIGAIAGPTGGYIIGFLFIPIIHYIFKKIFKSSIVAEFFSLLTGLIVCYSFGTAWFVLIYNNTGDIGILKAVSLCVVPFIIPDLIKLSLAIFISEKAKPILKKITKQKQS